MAKQDKAAKPAAEESEAPSRVGALHQAHADYIKGALGVDVTAEQVFAVYSTRVKFRKTDEYRVGVRAAKEAEKAAALEAAEQAKAAREEERKAKAAEKEAEKAKKAEEREVAKKAAAAKKTAADALKEADEAKAETATAKKTAAAAKKTGKGKAGKGTESPF